MVTRQPIRSVAEIEKDIRLKDFEVYYRIAKSRTRMVSLFPALLKFNDKWFSDNPDYVEGALCGKLKEKE